MNALKTLMIPLLMIIAWQLNAQTPHRCHSDEKMQAYFGMNPDFELSIEQGFKDFNENGPISNLSFNIITIPVHVIILHPPGQAVGTGDNLSMDHIMSQIDVLNEDFRALNADVSGVPSVFTAGDSEIEFCLASVDPDGNPTDGVTRYATNQSMSNSEFSLKQATGWPRSDYLNLWVDPNIGPLGWAYLPSTTGLPNAILDGCVIRTSTFGGPGYATLNPYNLGRTTTHEVGHYLGLRHIWRNGGCGADDGIADTPLQDNENFGCPNHPSPSCGNGGDMFMNYMDYVNDNCMIMFSPGQGAYMRQILNTSRSSLLSAASIKCSLAAPMVATILTQSDVFCFGESSGSVTVDVTGGISPYTYALNGGPPQSSPTFQSLFAGNYTITIFDSAGSQVDVDVTIAEPSLVTAFADFQINVSCFGGTDGSVTLDAFGGTPFPGNFYEYSLNGSSFTPVNIFTNLPSGTYTYQVQDANACLVSGEVTIEEPNELVLDNDSLSNIICFGEDNGMITLSATGGIPNYSFSLDQVDYQSNATFENLTPGDYTAYVQDNNNCISSYDFTITEPEVLTLDVSNQADVDCAGDNTGEVVLSAGGGSPNYQFSENGVDFQDSDTFSSLGAGDYQFVVEDDNGCQTTVDVTIEEPDAIAITVDSQTDLLCAGDSDGAFSVSANGGTGDLSFAINGNSSPDGNFADLSAGDYTVEVTDANDCSSSIEVSITEPEALTLENTAQTNVGCNGDSNGAVSLSANGGIAGYQYELNGQSNTDGFFDGLSAGTYTAIVTDANDCSTTLQIDIEQPTELSLISTMQIDVNCNGNANGFVSLSANGGVGNYEYTLSNQTNTTGQFNGLSAGDYTAMVVDANDCQSTLDFTIEEPAELAVSTLSQTNVSCNGESDGMIMAVSSGGTEPITYTLGSETNTTGVFENLSVGTYQIMVEDANACTTSIDASIEEPEVLEGIIIKLDDVSCNGEGDGSISLTAEGGTPDYQFEMNGETNTDGFFVNMDVGDYSIQITDANGCETTINLSIEEPEPVVLDVQQTAQNACNGDANAAIIATATGGNGVFTYSLNGQSNDTGIFDSLMEGIYMVMVSDEIGCTSSVEYMIEGPAPIVLNVEETQSILCAGEGTASIQVGANGGAGDYSFELDGITSTSGSFTDLAAGNYLVEVTDAAGCQNTMVFAIEEPEAIEVGLNLVLPVLCNGDDNAAIQVVTNGGTAPYSYMLDNVGNETGTFEGLGAGTYLGLITDANNCTQTYELSIEEPTAITAVADVQDVSCFGDSDGAISLSANGGTGALTFELDGQTNDNGIFSNLSSGDYVINIIDENNCVASLDVSVEEPEEVSVDITNIIDDMDGQGGGFTLVPQVGNSPFMYSINGGPFVENNVFTGLPAGDYEIEAMDAAGCSIFISVTIDLINDTFEPAYGVDAMKVWPNPFSNQLAIEIDLVSNQRLQMELFTIHGQKVIQQQVNLGQGEHLVWLKGTADLAKATYLLSVRNAEKIWYFKVLKQ